MSEEKVMVLTVYGRGRTADKISISSFDEQKGAKSYIRGIQKLELGDDHWVTARIVSEFFPYWLDEFSPLDFDFDILPILDDRAIQIVLREADSQVIAMALQDCDTEIKDKIFRNMSKRASIRLKEDMEYLGSVKFSDVIAARKQVLDILRRLEWEGIISLGGSLGGEELLI